MHTQDSSQRAMLATFVLGATLLLPLLGAASARSDGTAIQIHVDSRPLILTTYPNVLGGKHILARRYDVALSRLTDASLGPRSLTNLCALHTMSRDWIKARPACDAAVEAALRERKRTWYKPASERVAPDTNVAIAYANRAVMFLLSKDFAAGQRDLRQARAIRPDASYVTDNLVAAKECCVDRRR